MIISDTLHGHFDSEVIIRFNLAWHPKLNILIDKIKQHKNVLVDYPYKRKKPPHVNYDINDLLQLDQLEEVKYIALSNISSVDDLSLFSELKTHIIPKIENKAGVNNLEQIIDYISGDKIIMLDVEDLYIDSPESFQGLFDQTVKCCKNHNVKLFKIHGVVFTTF
ncbi:MAG: hypothetical protein DWQ19_09785 [Crenarchaeota archaeon]|nr:MAG: hypothetical protein DWQ19_09785 [Thermoproteota archaeon]